MATAQEQLIALTLKAQGIPQTVKGVKQVKDQFKDLGHVMSVTENKAGKLTARFDNFRGKLTDVSLETGKMTQQVTTLNRGFLGTGDHISRIMAKVTTWTVATGIIYGTVRALKAGVDTITEFDSSMVSLQKVFQGSQQELAMLKREVITTSVAMGSLTGDTMQAAIALGRMGKTRSEIAELTRVSLLAQNIAEMEAVDATKLLNAAILQFEKTADDAIGILDQWNELSNKTPVTTRDLASAMSIAGAVFNQAGGEIEDLNAMVSTLTATMAKSGNEIGTAMKTITSYAFRQKTMKEILRLTDIAVKDQHGNLMDIDELLARLSAKWHTLTEAQQEELAQTVAGVRRKGFFLNLMENFNMVLENQVIQWGAAGSAIQENEIRLSSLATKVTQLKAALEKLAINEGDTGLILPAMKGIIDGLRLFIDNLGEASVAMQLFSGVATYGAVKGVTALTTSVKFLNKALFKWTLIIGAVVGTFNSLVWLFTASTRAIRQQNEAMKEHVEQLKSQKAAQESVIDMSQTLNALYDEYNNLLEAGENEAAAKVMERIKNTLEGIEDLNPSFINFTNDVATNISLIGDAAGTAQEELHKLRQELAKLEIQQINKEIAEIFTAATFRPERGGGFMATRPPLSVGRPGVILSAEDERRIEKLEARIKRIRERLLPQEKKPKSTPAFEVDEKLNEQLAKEQQRHELAMARLMSEEAYIAVLQRIIDLTDDQLDKERLSNRLAEFKAQLKKKAADADERAAKAEVRRLANIYKRIGTEVGRGLSDSMVLAVTEGASRLDKLSVWNRMGQNIGDQIGSIIAEKMIGDIATASFSQILTGNITGALISGGIGILTQLLFPVKDPIDRNTEATEEAARTISELNDTMTALTERLINAPASFALTGSLPSMAHGGRVLASGLAEVHTGEFVGQPEQLAPYISQSSYSNSLSIGSIQVYAQPGQSEDVIADKVMNKIAKSYGKGGQYGSKI